MTEVKKSVDINAHITNIEYKLDKDNMEAKVSFDNLGYGIITAIKFKVRGYNSFGDIVKVEGKEEFILVVQDICVEEYQHAEDLEIKIPNNEIRRLELEEHQICYVNGCIHTYKGKDIREYVVQQFDECEEEKDLINAIKEKFGETTQCYPLELDCGWICGCGSYNNAEEHRCLKCRNSKIEIFKIKEIDYRNMLLKEYEKKEKEREECKKQEELIKEKEQRKQSVKKTIWGCILIVLAYFMINAFVMSGRTTYSSEAEMKKAVQGTYTYYDASGNAARQIIISGDTVTYKWRYAGELETTVKEWNYKKGVINTFEKLIVTNDGGLKDEGDVYKKGGKMNTVTSEDILSSIEVATSVLKFTNLEVNSNSSYTICTGSIKNTGKNTYKFVEIKGAFKNSAGTVIDTDWTYAVGSEGLEPGESKTFRLSVPKDSSITSCSLEIIDYSK